MVGQNKLESWPVSDLICSGEHFSSIKIVAIQGDDGVMMLPPPCFIAGVVWVLIE